MSSFFRTIRNSSGSVTIEGAVGLVSFSIMLTGAFFVSYFAFAKVWIDKQSYEALVCLGSLSQVQDCESDLRKKVEAALPVGRLSHLRVTRSSSKAEVNANFTFGDREIIRWQDSRSLPLTTSRGFR